MYNKLLLYTILIYFNFIFWGIIQEKLYDLNVLSKYNNVISVLSNALSLLSILPTKKKIQHLFKLICIKKNIKFFGILLITQTLTQPVSYFITSKFKVNYLFLQLSKSCKMIPVIFIHRCIYNKPINRSKIWISLMITLSIIIFNFKPQAQTSAKFSLSGVFLLLPLTMEGFTNTSQDQLFALNKLNNIDSIDLLLYNNLVNILVHCGYLLFWDQDQVVKFCGDKIIWSSSNHVMLQLILYLVLQVIGCNLIFKVLYEYDSLALLRITILRKVSSLLISCIFLAKGKKFSSYEIAGLTGVVLCLLLEFYLKKKQSHPAKKIIERTVKNDRIIEKVVKRNKIYKKMKKN